MKRKFARYNTSRLKNLHRRVGDLDAAVERTLRSEKIPLTTEDERRFGPGELSQLPAVKHSTRAVWACEAWGLVNSARDRINHAQKRAERGDFLSAAFTSPLTEAEGLLDKATYNLLVVDAARGRKVRSAALENAAKGRRAKRSKYKRETKELEKYALEFFAVHDASMTDLLNDTTDDKGTTVGEKFGVKTLKSLYRRLPAGIRKKARREEDL